MKYICTQENLHAGLAKIQGISNQATTLPILKNLLLEVKNGVLKIKGTNLEIGITTEIRGKAEEEGSAVIESKLINGFVNFLSQDKVILQTEGQNLIIESGSHRTKINGISAEDFPVIPEIEKGNNFKIGAKEIKRALLQIIPAVSNDDTRPEINGVYCEVKKNTMILAGTDSYRLAEKIVVVEENGFEGHCIIPLKTVKEFARTINDEDGMVEIYIVENQILFLYGRTELVSRLVDGAYPDYRQIIPKSYSIMFRLAKEDFLSAVKISGIFAAVGVNNVTLKLNPQENLFTLSSSATVGDEQTNLNVPIEGDQEIKIIFDYRYLLDGLNSIGGDEVVFWGTSESSPAVLKPSDEKESFLYIVMPIRQ